MYGLLDYRHMVTDRVRVAAYAQAITAAVRPDDVVLDLGCGIGVMSVLAARAGARRVYAVDVDDSVQYARRVVAENGVGDRVTLFRGRIQDVDLPEKPTLLVADLRGSLPFDVAAVATWNAGTARLAPGARTIPRRDTVFAQPIRSADMRETFHTLGAVEGVSFESLRGALSNGTERAAGDVRPLAEARPLFEIRYGAPLDGRYEGHADFVADGPWEIDGFLLGFESELWSGVAYRSFGPGRATVYGASVVPAPVRTDVAAGSRVRCHLKTDLLGEGVSLRWAVEVDGREGSWQGPLVEAGQSLDVLNAALPGHVPGSDARDDVDLAILSSFARGRSLAEAVAEALRLLPEGTSRTEIEARAMEISCRRQARVVRRFSGA